MTDPRTIYRTPAGSFTTWEEAATACERMDMDPCTCIEMVRAEVLTTCIEHAYGSAYRLPFQIRVF